MLVLVAASIAGWLYYAEWRIGRIELFTDDAPIVVQVLAERSDEAIGEPFDLHTRVVVSLPAGEYRLRVTGVGRLSRTYRFAVNRGETIAHTISIDEGRLLRGERGPTKISRESRKVEAIPFASTVAALELKPGKSDLITWSDESMTCRDGTTGTARWDLSNKRNPVESGHAAIPWLRFLSGGDLAEPAVDLDGDGWRDVLVYDPDSPVLLALSGKHGSPLWNHVGRTDGPGGPRDVGQVKNLGHKEWGQTAGKPAMADIDRDGVADFIVTFVFPSEQNGQELSTSPPESQDGELVARRCTIAAISGKSGRSLWAHSVDLSVSAHAGELDVQAAELVRGVRTEVVAFVDGTKWIGLDPVTGKPKAGPIELGFGPVRPVQYGDLDGDREPDLIAVDFGGVRQKEKIHAISITKNRELWSEVVDAPHARFDGSSRGSSFPLVADLDGDGKAEILVPDAGPMAPAAAYGGVRLLEGCTGETRWRRAMRREISAESGLAEAVIAPDLDGDGTRELITVSRVYPYLVPRRLQSGAPEDASVYVDAFSGRDGRPFWWWKVNVASEPGEEPLLWTPIWWGRGPDGWPLLAVPLGGLEGDTDQFQSSSVVSDPIVHVLEAATGNERHVIGGLAQVHAADLDGDGLTDLWGEVDHELRAVRGEAPEAWCALGTFRPAASSIDLSNVTGRSVAADFDGDQIADVLIGDLDELLNGKNPKAHTYTAQARSGRDGHLIWKTELDPWEHWLHPTRVDDYRLRSFALPQGDFDGDGTVDVIVQGDSYQKRGGPGRSGATLDIQLLSGRTGARLWSAGVLGGSAVASGVVSVPWSEPRLVERGGAPDLIVGYVGQVTKPAAKRAAGLGGGMARLARISGRDGRVLWDMPVSGDRSSDFFYLGTPWTFFDDLDGDGALDLALFSPASQQSDVSYALVAVSLRDGRRLWFREFGADITSPTRPIDKLDGPDGPAFVVMEDTETAGWLALRAFGGRDGRLRWTTKVGQVRRSGGDSQSIVAASFNGKGAQEVCISYNQIDRGRQIVVFDANGKERARREVKGTDSSVLEAADVNGDGRDELLLFNEGRFWAWDGELKDVWSWPTKSKEIDANLRGTKGRPSEVVLSQAFALDGATGRPRWTGQRLLTQDLEESPRILEGLSDGDESRGMPLLIANGLGATVCREALRTDESGAVAAARGRMVQPGRDLADPRWLRPLPWVVALEGPLGPWGFLTAGVLAGVNVLLPWLIIRLVRGKRRSFSVRGLMTLPAAAAIPLMVYLTFVPWLPLGTSRFLETDARLFVTGTLGGLPIALGFLWLGVNLARRRMRRVIAMAGLSVAAALVLAGGWLWWDRKSMAVVEHYGWEGCGSVLLPGAYAAALLWVVVRLVVGAFRLIRRAPQGSVGV